VGNGTRVVVSEMAGRSTLAMKAVELGIELDGEVLGRVLDQLKRLEHEGYHFEVADGSLELLLRRATGWVPDFFDVESFRVITDHVTPPEGDADELVLTAAVRATTRPRSRCMSASTGWWPPPRATARSTRSTPPSARRSAPTTPSSAPST